MSDPNSMDPESETLETKSVTLFDPAADAKPPEMPEVQEHAIQAARERIAAESGEGEQPAQEEPPASAPVEAASPTAPAGPVKGQTDVDGNTYDPAIHESPLRLNRDGYIAKRRGGKKKNGESPQAYRSTAAPIDDPAPSGENSAPEVPDAAKIESTAVLFTNLFIGGAQMIGGPEFAPENQSEVKFLKDSLATYFQQAGVVDVPPSVGVAIAYSMYIAKRWNKPEFTSRRVTWYNKAKLWFFERFKA